MLGLGFRIGTVASVLARLPAAPFVLPTPGTRLALSTPLSLNVAVPTGAHVMNRTTGTTFTTNWAGLAIDSASGALTGTPGSRAGLVTEHFPDGTTRNNLLFALDTGARTAKVGMNFSTLYYYEENIAFLDYLKGAQDVSTGGTYDANGMPQPRTDGSGYSFLFPMDDGTVTPFGIRLITDGDFDFGVTVSASTGFVGGYLTFTKSGPDYVATWSYSKGQPGVVANFSIGTIRTAPTYIAIVREEDVAAYKAYLAGTRPHIFKDSFIAEMSRYSRIRFMDAVRTNDDDLPNPLPTRTSITYARYLPTSIQADLCIACNANWWQNVFVKATNADYQATWPDQERVKAAGLRVCAEFSNEVWNTGFGQFYYSGSQFAAAGGILATQATDGNSNPVGPSPETQRQNDATGRTIDNQYCKAQWYYGYRAAQLAILDRGRDIDWTIGYQTNNQDPTYGGEIYIDLGVKYAGGNYSDFVFWIVTAYPNGSWNNPQNDIGATHFAKQQQWVAAQDVDAGIDDYLNYIGTHSYSATALNSYLATAKQNAETRGLVVIAYEAHPNVSDAFTYTNDAASYPGFVDFLSTMKNDPLSTPAAQAALQINADAGITEFTMFNINDIGEFNILRSPIHAGLIAYLAQPYAPNPDITNVLGSSTIEPSQIAGATARLERVDAQLTKLGV